MLVRRIARPLLASVFVAYGIDAIRKPRAKADVAEPVIDLIDEHVVQPAAQKVAVGSAGAVDDMAEALSAATYATAAVGETEDIAAARAWDASDAVHEVAAGRGIDFTDETYVRANGAVQVVGGVLLATGKAPRLASAALAASLVPTTLGGHRFWEAEGDERAAQQIHFLKNVSLLGGLLLAAVDTEGRPGLAWRAHHLRQDAGPIALAVGASAKVAGRAARADAKAAARLARANARVAGKDGKLAAEVAGDHAARIGHQVSDKAAELAPQVRDLAAELGPQVRDRVAEFAPQVRDKASELGPQVREMAAELAPHMREMAAELGPQVRDKAAELAPIVRERALAFRDR